MAAGPRRSSNSKADTPVPPAMLVKLPHAISLLSVQGAWESGLPFLPGIVGSKRPWASAEVAAGQWFPTWVSTAITGSRAGLASQVVLEHGQGRDLASCRGAWARSSLPREELPES